MLAIINLYRRITSIRNNYELQVHHKLSPESVNRTEEFVDKFIKYFHKHSNPFAPEKSDNAERVLLKSTKDILNVFNKGCKLYKKFCSERFKKKSILISHTQGETSIIQKS